MAYRKKTDEREEKKARLKNSTKNRDAERRVQKTMVIIFVIVLIFVVVKGVISFVELKSQQKEVEAKYESLVSEKEELENTLEYINTPEYIEKAARDMLKMVMPGEILYVLKDENGDKPGQSDSIDNDKSDGDNAGNEDVQND